MIEILLTIFSIIGLFSLISVVHCMWTTPNVDNLKGFHLKWQNFTKKCGIGNLMLIALSSQLLILIYKLSIV